LLQYLKENKMDNATPTQQFYNTTATDAELYDQYLGPMFFEPYAIEIASRIEPSSTQVALELAAGTGRVTRHLRHRLSLPAKLIASDISEDMLRVAKEKLKDENIDWQIIDAQQLPFETNSIDLVVCCFGLMFVPDRLKAVSEVYRVLRTGGMFIFSTWDKLETVGASSVYRNIVKQYLTGPLPPSYDLPTSMHDESIIKPLLLDAGFSKISIEKVSKQSYCSSAKEAAEGLTMRGAIYHEIMSRNPESIGEIKNLVEKELSEKYGAAPMIAPMSAVISQAWK
jgi:ubiquinone/menaquinone biosynthesis C-methylase UbiE